ncbi:MAG: class I SAM-dependent methyltransferase [Magnetococcales bacterium]|nr:class I SAM-dependent methyltransferase [Magnetococcales bacterium]
MKPSDLDEIFRPFEPLYIKPNPVLFEQFKQFVADLGFDREDPWIVHYVQYVLENEWPLYSAYGPVTHKKILEFGCNVGATAIVLSQAGAQVWGVDVNDKMVEIARKNAQCHNQEIEFLSTRHSWHLPWSDGYFDYISCNSVLEYVEKDNLKLVLTEISRLLKPGGRLLIFGTSNRLSPIEVHSKKWGINYIPTRLLPLFKFLYGSDQVGISYSRIRRELPGFYNLDVVTDNQIYLGVKKNRFGENNWRYRVLKWAALILKPFKIPVGAITPSIQTVFVKK